MTSTSDRGDRWTGCGVLYIATGRRYVEEALRSARSVQEAMPGLPITLLTDDGSVQGTDIDVRRIAAPRSGIADKVSNLRQTPYDWTLFLDADTHVCGDLSGCFRLLDHFDLLVAHDALRVNRNNPDIDRSFPECNSGLIFFRKSPDAIGCLDAWKEGYNQDCRDHGGRQMPDQYSFRKALRTSPARFYVLPPEYHCMTWEASYLHDSVKVVHGRHDLPLSAIGDHANAVAGPRIFKAGLGAHRIHYKPDVIGWGARVLAAQLREALSGPWLRGRRADSGQRAERTLEPLDE